ncbi:MAG: Gfo/Idh/MocA family protein [Sphaerochaetaceae bacterium]|jgi:predicted dehydrogenase|nr:Gfo/Idh/MocA family oxidoreductase [Sphaerochaetaceae bacterium]HHU88379.1 Gfo/Idh/MocA family oxidoreductase [Spirochaetales bacterium]
MRKSRWGILGTADIARRQFIPSLQASGACELVAVASRDKARAAEYAKENNIPLSYGSYEELLGDPSIEFIYIPLPNHLHVEWTRRAVEAGKHVLCEKPLALSVEEIEELMALRAKSGKLIGEAYATLHQERLQGLRELFVNKELGSLSSAHGVFYLYNDNPQDVRNAFPCEEGGGSLWDIGVYPLVVGRWMFGEEPVEVACLMERDPLLNVDNHTSGLLRFPNGGQMSFACGMRHPLATQMTFYTDKYRIEVDRTYFSNSDEEYGFKVYGDETEGVVKSYTFRASDQYRLECENFARSAYTGVPFSGSLENTLNQTKVILALLKAANSGEFERV